MRLSKNHLKTLREAPSDAVLESHKLLVRANMIKQESAGIYMFPKLAPYMEQMKHNLAVTLGIREDAVNVKATTEEGLGFTGRGEGMAAMATAAIEGSF